MVSLANKLPSGTPISGMRVPRFKSQLCSDASVLGMYALEGSSDGSKTSVPATYMDCVASYGPQTGPAPLLWSLGSEPSG